MGWLRSLWQRIKSLFRANAHAALDKMEDPEKMADEYIRQLEQQYVEAKRGTAEAMAQATRLAQKRDQAREEADAWERKAEAALRKEDEALARSALERKRQFATTASEYATQCEVQEAQVESIRKALARIETQINEARAKRELIKAKAGRARSQEAIGKVLHGSNASGAMFDRMDAMEEKIDGRLYQAEAMAKLETDSLVTRFEDLERTTSVDDELAALKQKVSAES